VRAGLADGDPGALVCGHLGDRVEPVERGHPPASFPDGY
jgi:hypothetical protein